MKGFLDDYEVWVNPSVEHFKNLISKIKGNSMRNTFRMFPSLSDDLGNYYDLLSNGGGSASDDDFKYEWSLSGPLISSQAKEITTIIQEILFEKMRFAPVAATTENTMTEFRSSQNKSPPFLIVSGPWEFKIRLD